jgi:hypothetical protein
MHGHSSTGWLAAAGGAIRAAGISFPIVVAIRPWDLIFGMLCCLLPLAVAGGVAWKVRQDRARNQPPPPPPWGPA